MARKRNRESHRDALYEKARLENKILEYLRANGAVSIDKLMDTFNLTREETHRMIQDFRQANVVSFSPQAMMCSLTPLPA